MKLRSYAIRRAILAAIAMMSLGLSMGCAVRDRAQTAEQPIGAKQINTNETSTEDKAIDIAVGNQKLGVPECDELFDALAEQAKSPDDNLVSKTAKRYFLGKLRADIKKSLDKNKSDQVRAANECREFKSQLDRNWPAANKE